MPAAVLLFACLLAAAPVRAQVKIAPVSSDTFTNSASQHATEVEPDSASNGSTIVAAFQVGRIFSGGAADIGFATSTDGGATWTNGYLPGITKAQGQGNPYDAISDAAVAYDALHNSWLISSLPLVNSGAPIPAVVVSSSTDGISWNNPVSVGGNVEASDKDWITCDNWTTSKFYGNCYVEWDDPFTGIVYMSTSTDGGQTWTNGKATNANGLGGQPLVRPNGTVVVPYLSNNISAFYSSNGGATWSNPVTISTLSEHTDAGGLRSISLPSAREDGAGKIYVVWQDCRFRTKCSANDIVMSTSSNGTQWSKVARIPIDPVTSTVDHFIPGLGVDITTSGATAHLGLMYYFYPKTSCTTSTCALNAGYIASTNGGRTWIRPLKLAGPMHLSSLPNTFSGYMVGDYMTTSFANGGAFAIISNALPKVGSKFNQAMYVPVTALPAIANGPQLTSEGDKPVPGAKSDHPPLKFPVFIR